jgi:hypothetical protein
MAFPTSAVLNWVPCDNQILPQGLNTDSTTKNCEIGRRVKARDQGTAQLGEGIFIYIKATAAVAAGQAVSYDLTVPSAELLVDDGRIGQVGIAWSAIASGSFGWVQISGAACAKYLTNAGINLLGYVTATAGSISSDVVAGDIIMGSNFKTAADLCGTKTATGYCTVQLSEPFVQSV